MGSIIINDFHGGLDDVSQPTRKDKQMADAMNNVIVSTRNAVAKKDGSEPINANGVAYGGGAEILSIYDFLLQQDTIVRMHIFQAGTELFALDQASGTAGVIKSGLRPDSFQYAVSNRAVYMGNGLNMLKYYQIAGYSLFADFTWFLTDPYETGRTALAQSFISEHGKDRNCASVHIPLIRIGPIPSTTKLTIEIQTDTANAPSGTAILNGVSNEINGDVPVNWNGTTFTFGSTLPILEAGVKYWIVFQLSAFPPTGSVIGWGVDSSGPEFDDGNFSVNDGGWVDQPNTVSMFRVYVEPDQWGIEAPTTAPSVNGAAVTNPDFLTGQDADEELRKGNGSSQAELAQSWEFEGEDDRSISQVTLFLKKTGLPLGNLQVTIKHDDLGKPGSSELVDFQVVSASSLGTSYAFVTFTAVDPVILRANTKYWLHLSGDQTYLDEYVQVTTSVSWGVDGSSPNFATGELARRPGPGASWGVDNAKDALFSVVSSLQNAGGRKYAYSFVNSVTGHVSNRSPGSERSGNFDIFTISNFEIPTDPQVDEIIVWATTDGGEIFFKLTEAAVNTGGDIAPLIGSEAPLSKAIPISDSVAGVKGAWVELVASLTTASTWVTLSFGAVTGDLDPIGEFDIGLGGAGSEVVIIPDIMFVEWFNFVSVDGGSGMTLSFPIAIPAGSRISVRCKDNLSSAVSYGVQITVYNPNLTGGGGSPGLTSFVDGPVTEDDLDFTVEAPLCNFLPPLGTLVSRAKGSIVVAGTRNSAHTAFYSAGLGQTLVGVREESFPPFNFVTIPSGGERIYNIDTIDGAPILFTTGQLFTIAGETPETFRVIELRGGKGVGSVSREGSASTEVGLFFFSSDRKVYLIPTRTHIPVLVSAIVEDAFERISPDSTLQQPVSMDKVRMEFWNFGDRHWILTSIPTGGDASENNELWVYDLDLHNSHNGRGWFGPLLLEGGQGYQALRVIEDPIKDKRLFMGDADGFIREYGVGNQDGGINFTSSYTFPFLDDDKPDMVKDALVVEVIVPAGQTMPANFLEVSYDSETDFETIPLVQVNEMKRGATTSHKYRGYLISHFTRIKPRVNFAVEDAPGELWQLRIDYEDLYDSRGHIHDA